jgi:capsular polysaccharide biosynthesis protein
MVAAAGSIAGLALGLAFLAFLEYRDSSFRTEDDVVRVLSLPVLALVPVIATDSERSDG